MGIETSFTTAYERERTIARNFFRLHPLMSIATVSREQESHTSAVYVHVADDLTCYFVTKRSTEKYADIAEQGAATLFVIDEPHLMCGEIMGGAAEVTSEQEIVQFLPQLQDLVSSRMSEQWVPPIGQIEGEDYAYIRVRPKRVKLADYNTSINTSECPLFIRLHFAPHDA